MPVNAVRIVDKRCDSTQMVQRRTRNGRLIAPAHFQGVDTTEMSKGGIRNGSLIAHTHIQGVDTL